MKLEELRWPGQCRSRERESVDLVLIPVQRIVPYLQPEARFVCQVRKLFAVQADRMKLREPMTLIA